MPRDRAAISLLILAFLQSIVLSGCATRSEQRFTFTQIHMGARARILLYAPDEESARDAARAGFARIAELESVMSDYREDSEAMWLSAQSVGRWTPVSRDLFRVLRESRDLARATHGAFDHTLGPITSMWRESRLRSRLPEPAAREAAIASTGWRHVELDAAGSRARLMRSGMRFDFGGIGKGHAAHLAALAIAEAGATRCLVDLGGDMYAGAPPRGERGWRVAVETGYGEGARPVCLLSHAALATSGDTEQYVELEGVRYSHIVDPRTGLGLTSRAAATVYARDGATADALASAVCVLGPAKARGVVGPMEGIGVRLVVDGEVFELGSESQRIETERARR